MEEERKYRHEYKFLLDAKEGAKLYYRLKNLIPLDENVRQAGSYWIRSVYFDDYRNSCYQENESGINERAKYRIRIYNVSDKRIHLERKSKRNGMTLKESADLTREQCEMLLAGRPLPVFGEQQQEQPEVLKQFCALMMTKGMRPKVIVEYERVPFVYREGNVRITLDRNITSSTQVQRFFERDTLRYPVLSKGRQLLEVKFDEFFPGFIRQSMETGKLQQISFSKYYLGRKYTVPCIGGRLK